MHAQRLVIRGRLAAERLMVDRCRVERVTGRTENPDATVTPTYTTVYEGKCKLQSQNAYPSEPDAGDRQWVTASPEVHLPMDGTGGVQTDDVVTVLASFDPDSVGRKFRVRSNIRKTFQTAARLLVEEVTG